METRPVIRGDVWWWGSGAHPLGGMERGVPVAGPFLRSPWAWPLSQAVSIQSSNTGELIVTSGGLGMQGKVLPNLDNSFHQHPRSDQV